MTSGTRVYIGRISYDVRERDVEKFFKGYGRIREILLKDGFAFVEFDDQRDAEDAVYELNGKDLLGERVHVEFARGPTRGRGGRFGGGGRDGGRYSSYGSSRGSYGSRNGSSSLSYSEKSSSRYGPPRNTEYRVIVENLSSRVSWQDLKDFMRQAGEVTYADAHKREKNMGIVDFASYSDMKAALEKLDGHDLHGRRLRLHEDKSRRRRSHSRSRSPRPRRASKSRSRSRSRSVSKSRSRSMSSGRSKSRSRSSSPPPRRSDRGDAGDHKDGTKSPASRSSRSRSRSRSKSPVVAASNGAARREASGGDAGDRKNSHRSMSRSRSRSGSARSRSRSLDKSGSRSRSRSPMSRDSRSPSVHSDNSRHSGDAD